MRRSTRLYLACSLGLLCVGHADRTYRFGWDQATPGAIPSARWEKEGLCRVAVRGGNFVVLFPKLGRPVSDR
jgi:hypothetical protein